MCPSYFIFFIFFSPEVPERNPWNFFPRRSRRGTLETLLLVFFSSSSFVVRRVSMGILETDTWPEQDHKRESTLAQTFEKTVHFCILALGSRAWCARIPDNSSLVHLEKDVRERSKEKRRSVVEDLGRWAGKTEQQREKGAQNGAQPSWQRALCRGPFWRIWAAERPRRSTLERNHMGRSVLPKRSTRRTAKETMSITAEKVTPPHPTQPNPSSVRVFASEHERYYTRPHPTQPKPDPSSARVFRRWTLLPHPTPPNQSPTPAQCVCLQANMNVITQPHPTPPHQLLRVHTWDSRRGVVCACAREPKDACAGQAQTGGRSLLEDGVGKRCTRL